MEGFDRTADAGVVNVANMDLNADPKAVYPFPPAKVTDLQVIGMSYENETVTLQWTSVGDYEEQETGMLLCRLDISTINSRLLVTASLKCFFLCS